MALSNHPLVRELINGMENGSINDDNFDPEPLRKAKILKGLKILDLGCGPEPTFARASRRFGADVWTVDVIPASMFDFDEKYFTKRDRQIEVSRHIQLDLRVPDAAEKIITASGGNFDLVTEAHLTIGWNWDEFGDVEYHEGDVLAMKLLKKGGFHYRVRDNRLPTKKE
ncbi:MAG: hypothetical protein QXU54_03680 [Candidatus Micrarchaeia archaeon]